MSRASRRRVLYRLLVVSILLASGSVSANAPGMTAPSPPPAESYPRVSFALFTGIGTQSTSEEGHGDGSGLVIGGWLGARLSAKLAVGLDAWTVAAWDDYYAPLHAEAIAARWTPVPRLCLQGGLALVTDRFAGGSSRSRAGVLVGAELGLARTQLGTIVLGVRYSTPFETDAHNALAGATIGLWY